MADLVRYDPVQELAEMERAMDRWFGEMLWPTWPEPALTSWLGWPELGVTRFPGDNLAVDLVETDDALIVKASLPGVDPDSIQVEEQNGILTIRAKSQEEKEWGQAGWRVRERRMGVWQRSLRLPAEVRSEKAKAEYKDGVLTVTLPKVAASKKLTSRVKVKLPKLSLPKLGKKEKEGKVKVRTK